MIIALILKLIIHSIYFIIWMNFFRFRLNFIKIANFFRQLFNNFFLNFRLFRFLFSFRLNGLNRWLASFWLILCFFLQQFLFFWRNVRLVEWFLLFIGTLFFLNLFLILSVFLFQFFIFLLFRRFTSVFSVFQSYIRFFFWDGGNGILLSIIFFLISSFFIFRFFWSNFSFLIELSIHRLLLFSFLSLFDSDSSHSLP